jgi:hypothetical protein
MKPKILIPKPSVLMGIIGGAAASIFLIAILQIAPLVGWRTIDYPQLLGGVLTDDRPVAFWGGYALFIFLGTAVFPALLHQLWVRMPGHNVAYSGAVLKGLFFGFLIWILSGLLFPLFSYLNQISHAELGLPSFFAVDVGWSAAAVVLIAHLGYGLALALLSAMPQGIVHPLDLLGWHSHAHGDIRDVSVNWIRLPQYESAEQLRRDPR